MSRPRSKPGVKRALMTGIAARVLVAQLALVVLLVAAGIIATVLLARRGAAESARREVLSVAAAIAATPTVRDGLSAREPSKVLQPFAEAARVASGADFIVVMSRTGIRYTHPNPARIGGQFEGHIAAAQAGRSITETYTGSLGPSVRSVVPVIEAGRVIGLVSVGIRTQTVWSQVSRQVPVIAAGGVIALLAATGISVAVGRRLHRQTIGLGPRQLGLMYQSHDAVLHSIREGLLVLDRDRRLQLINDEGRRLLRIDGDAALGRPVAELRVGGTIGELLRTGRTAHDESHTTGGKVVLASQADAVAAGQLAGTVMTLRDRTELQELSGERDQLRSFTDSLRAVAHESANRLHTIVALIELGRPEEAVRLATRQMADSQRLTDQLAGDVVGRPELAALLLAQSARAAEVGVNLTITGSNPHATGIDSIDLLTIVGNLVDNAIDAAADGDAPREVEIRMEEADMHLRIVVADSGYGLADDDIGSAFQRGWSTKSDAPLHGRGLGLALVGDVVRRLAGTLEVGRKVGAEFTVTVPLTGAAVPGDVIADVTSTVTSTETTTATAP